jgi:hypothetical protein
MFSGLRRSYFINNIEYCTITRVWDFVIDKYLHRDGDLPAYISHEFGDLEWWQNGKLHRDGNKPAVISYVTKKIIYSIQCWKKGKYYWKFNLSKMFYLQILIRFLYFSYKNKILWSPNNLAGKVTKKQILELFLKN